MMVKRRKHCKRSIGLTISFFTDAVNGYSRTIARRCSHYDVGNMCQASEYSSEIENCYKTCKENGCNLGLSETFGFLEVMWQGDLSK